MATGQLSAETSARGAFVRQGNHFTDRVTADGSSGHPVQPGRYRLVVSLACPWAQRSMIVRSLLGLEDAISLAVVDPIRDERGWRFTLDEGGRDPVTGAAFLSELYEQSDPSFAGRWTVPVLYDTVARRIVSNDYPQITLDLSTQWRALHAPGAPDLYPGELRQEIDAVNAEVYADVNNGVYRCGFATSQEAYEEAYERLFRRLDLLSERAALPGGRPADRGRRAAVHDAGALRRGLPRALQGEPAHAHADAGAVGVRPTAVRPARLRRHHRTSTTSSGTTTARTTG